MLMRLRPKKTNHNDIKCAPYKNVADPHLKYNVLNLKALKMH